MRDYLEQIKFTSNLNKIIIQTTTTFRAAGSQLTELQNFSSIRQLCCLKIRGRSCSTPSVSQPPLAEPEKRPTFKSVQKKKTLKSRRTLQNYLETFLCSSPLKATFRGLGRLFIGIAIPNSPGHVPSEKHANQQGYT